MHIDTIAPSALHIPHASASWALILQSGAVVRCTVGIPLSLLLRRELQLKEEQLRLVEAFLLDGIPVDDLEQAVVGDGSRLALAAGLPGIAGLAMKSGSAVRALRDGITTEKREQPALPSTGSILLSLYSLVLPVLGPHFLQRGIIVSLDQLRRYGRSAHEALCRLDGLEMTFSEFLSQPFPPGGSFFLTADLK